MKKSIIAVAVVSTILSGAAFANVTPAEEEKHDILTENFGTISVGLSSESFETESKDLNNAGADDYTTSRKDSWDVKLLNLGYYHQWKTVRAELNYGIVISGDNATSKTQGTVSGCNGDRCGDMGLSGYKLKSSVYANINSLFSGVPIPGDLEAYGSIQVMDLTSDRLTKGDISQTADLEDKRFSLGLMYSDDISDDMVLYVSAGLVKGNTKVPYSVTDSGGFVVTQDGNYEIDYVAGEFGVGASYYLTENLAFSLEYNMLTSFSEDGSATGSLDKLADLTVTNQSVSMSSNEFKAGLQYSF